MRSTKLVGVLAPAISLTISYGLATSTASAQFRITRIAMSGDLANPATGHVFSASTAFEPPSLNASGVVVFASKAGNTATSPWLRGGVWTGDGTSRTIIAYGQEIAGSREGPFQLHNLEYRYPVINDSGVVAFTSPGAVVTNGSGSLYAVVRNVDPAVGGGYYSAPGSFAGCPRIDASGQVLSRLLIIQPVAEGMQVLLADSTTQTVVMRPGHPFGSSSLTAGGATEYVLNTAPGGHVYLYGNAVDSTGDHYGILDITPSGASFAIREGQVIPDYGGRTVVSVRDQFASSDNGVVAASGRVTGITPTLPVARAIMTGPSGSPRIIGLEGQSAPGFPANYKFSDFSRPSLSSNGETLFVGFIYVQDTWAIYKTNGGSLDIVARAWEAAPGCGGATFVTWNNLPAAYGLNARGQALIKTTLSDGTDGIFGTDPAGVFRLIAATGRPMKVGPGDVRTLSYFRLETGNSSSIVDRNVFNDRGHVAFLAWFTDGSEGVFRASLSCFSDYNDDGFVSGDDFDAFVADFELGNDAADVNQDSFVSGDDFDQFIDHFVAGC